MVSYFFFGRRVVKRLAVTPLLVDLAGGEREECDNRYPANDAVIARGDFRNVRLEDVCQEDEDETYRYPSAYQDGEADRGDKQRLEPLRHSRDMLGDFAWEW